MPREPDGFKRYDKVVSQVFRQPSLEQIRRLVAEANLPGDDLETLDLSNFLGCGTREQPDGVVGLELQGTVALLRSLAVATAARGAGLGRALVAAAENHAQARGVRSLYLLTTTAAGFFERLGYRHADRASAPEALRQTEEFSSLCPSSASFMVKELPPPPYQIRPASGRAELEACVSMMARSEPWITLGRSAAASLELLERPGKEVYVAERNGQVLGFVLLDLGGPFPGYLQTVCVAPEGRGQGLGTRLMDFAEQRIFRESPNVFLCVSSFNPRARALYDRLGYQLVGVLKGYLVAGHDEILLRKSRGSWSEYRPKD